MNTQMGSSLPSEKLDRNNFASWEYKMYQYLVGQGYWSYIRAEENRPDPTNPEYSTWEHVGDKDVNAEDQTALCVMKNLRMTETQRYAHRERER